MLTPVHLALVLPARPVITEGHAEGLRRALLYHLFTHCELHPYVYAEKIPSEWRNRTTLAQAALYLCHNTGFYFAEEIDGPNRGAKLSAVVEKGKHGAIILKDGQPLPTIGNTLVRDKSKFVIAIGPAGDIKTYNHSALDTLRSLKSL